MHFRRRTLVVALCLTARLVAGGQTRSAPPLITLDLDAEHHRQVVVDREAGQYLGHPTTCLLEDGRTLLCVYPRGHGQGAIVYKRSTDGGLTWSERLPTPESWAGSKEVPTLHRVIGPDGTKRIILWSGLYPARLAVTEDDGANWSELQPVGDWGGIVVMGFVCALTTGPGHYLAMFHDDGRFFQKEAERTGLFRLYKTFSEDGGLTWSLPSVVHEGSDVHLCEPGCIRSPDGKRLAVLLRENARRKNSHVIFSDDEGRTWSTPRELPLALTGDRHTGKDGPDGRLLISFRCNSPEPKREGRRVEGDWVAWVGTFDDLENGSDGQYLVRLKDNTKAYDTAYPGVEILPDGTFVATTYGHWEQDESPYILSTRLKLAELDALARGAQDFPGSGHSKLIKECVQKLIELQEESGCWPYEGRYRIEGEIPVAHEVGGTALACLALLYAADPQNGQAQAAFQSGLKFVLSRLDHPQLKQAQVSEYDLRAVGQAYALLFLSHVKRQQAEGPDERSIGRWIQKLSNALVHEQMNDGGWNYQGRPVHASFVTASVVQALLWARSAGAEIPREAFRSAARVLEASRMENGAFFYFGTLKSTKVGQAQDRLPGSVARAPISETMLQLLGRGSAEEIQTSIDNFHEHWGELEQRRQQTGTHAGPYLIAPYYFYYGHRYVAQAIELLPQADREQERERLLGLLLRTRDADGTWNDREFPRSKNYGTAMAVLSLLSEKIGLPLGVGTR